MKKLNKLGLLFSLTIVLTFFLSLSLKVEAHTAIEKSYPVSGIPLEEPPVLIELLFLDSVELHAESFQLIGENGNKYETAQPFVNERERRHITIPIKEELPPGHFTVHIDVIAADGHPLTESFQFEIKKPIKSAEDQFRNLKLNKSEPKDGMILSTSPKKIEIWFTEQAELSVFGLFDDEQQLVTTSEPIVDPNNPKHFTIILEEELTKGTYTVNWYATIGNKSKNGVFYFAFNEVTSLVDSQNQTMKIPLMSFGHVGFKQLADWLAFFGIMTLFGGTWFSIYIAKQKGNQKRWRKVSLVLYALGIIGLLMLLVERRITYSYVSWTDYFSLRFTWLTILQLFLLSIAYWLARKIERLYVFFLFITVILWGLMGHSASERYGGMLGIAVDALHVIAVSIWLGGIFAFVIMTPKTETGTWLKKVGGTFSTWALMSMVTIVGTGILMTITYVPTFTFSSLLSSEWGTMLSIKVLFSIMILAFAIKQRCTLKRVVIKRIQPFISRLKIEIILGVFVLIAAAILIDLEPSNADQGVYPNVAIADGMEVSVDIEPFQIGKNDVNIHVKNAPYLKEVRTTFFMFPSWRMKNTAFPVGDGQYQLTGNFLHGAGTIFMEVEVVHESGNISVFPFRIQVPGKMPEDIREMYWTKQN
ncbi:copper resistance CopC/CopD family protein [Halalkalibacter urbisdiaboli]|uniref:copper resistance CopC/CopD family protein n=1 Tax=Halalkalibacter urbisdiaboli TaxID=1960589 RepID=UPI000B44C2E8|nr:copper resistance protein CopC [Halalkalibacter urbisdiaboli]